MRSAVLFGPILLGVTLAILAAIAIRIPWQAVLTNLAIYALGFSLFVWAKMSVEPDGPYFGRKPIGMTKKNRILYRGGYAMMLFGVCASVLLWVADIH